MSFEGLPKADYDFITDIHPNHMDAAGVAKVKKDGTTLVGPPSVNEKMPMGVVMKNGESHDFGTFKVDAVPMQIDPRSRCRKLLPRQGTRRRLRVHLRKSRRERCWGGGRKKCGADANAKHASRLYVAGDTECTPEMKALKNIDIAFVPMNLPYTMPPSEAAACVNAFKPKVVFPFHHRGSSVEEFAAAVKPPTDVRIRKWY